MHELTLTFTGRTPLVLHNVRLANPLDPYTKALKAISAKRKKTEDDHLEMIRLEWEGGLYIDDENGPYVPVSYPVACLREAGVITRHKTTIKRAVSISALDGGQRIPIKYDGPRGLAELWELDEHRDVRPVRVNSARTLRARPRFPEWAIEFCVTVDAEQLDLDVFEAIAGRAGRNIGLGEAPEGNRARFDVTVGAAREVAIV